MNNDNSPLLASLKRCRECGSEQDPYEAKIDRLLFDNQFGPLFGVRAYNCIKANVSTVGGLLSKTSADVLKWQGMGRKTLVEVELALRKYGLSLKEDNDE